MDSIERISKFLPREKGKKRGRKFLEKYINEYVAGRAEIQYEETSVSLEYQTNEMHLALFCLLVE